MSSRDFNGSHRSAGGRGIGKYVGGAWRAGGSENGHRASYARGAVGAGGRSASGYADGGGWGDDGYWREPDGGSGNGGRGGNGSGQNGSAGNGTALRPGLGTTGRGRHSSASGGGAGGPGRRGPGGPRGYGKGPGRGPRRGRAGRADGTVKVKGSWWRHWTLRKALGVLAASVASFILISIGGIAYVYSKTPVPTAELAFNKYQASTVYFSDGKTVIGTFGNYHRQPLTYSQIPKIVQDAVLAAEDRNFFNEGGISPRGILRAAFADLTGGDGLAQGGSTITQEFVRQYYEGIGTQKTMTRKIKEIFVAMKVAKEKSKDWILTQYLNTIYLGQGSYGIGAAAQTYFGEPVSKLTVAQAAVIAAIIQQPTNYPQERYKPELEARWHYVLNGMVSMGDITAQQAATMKFPAMSYAGPQSVGPDAWDPYILGQVQNELEDVYKISPQQMEDDGLKIYTTISRPMEEALYRAVNQNEKLMREDGGALPWYALVGAELQDPATGAILAEYPGRGQNMSAKRCAKYDCDNNTAAYATEQVGSSFKPYVLMQAVKEGMNVKTSILNGFSPLWVPPDSQPMTLSSRAKAGAAPESFQFHNDGMTSYGPMTVANAIAQSSNTAFTDLIHRVGTANVVQLASEMGIDPVASGLKGDIGSSGMALGQDSLTVNNQASMLATIDDNGMYHSAHVIREIVDSQTNAMTPAKVTATQILTSQQDSQVQYAMSFDTINGTGTAAAMSDGRPIIAKTGTTDNARSAFFIGAIPQAALTVGIFTEKQGDKVPKPGGHGYMPNTESLNGLGGTAGGGFGGYWPARIWNTFMEDWYGHSQIEPFQSPIFTGALWNQVGFLPKPPQHHKQQPPPPTHHRRHPGPITTPPIGQPSLPVTGASPPATAGATANGTATVSGAQAGAAAGGILVLLPGTLIWTRVSRRRARRRRTERTARVRTPGGSP